MDDCIEKFPKLNCKDDDTSAMKTVLKNFSINKRSFTLCNQTKCAKIAMEKISRGNELFASSSSTTDELLKIYSTAIAYAPNDSPQLAKAYGNRSAVLCNARLYEDSLMDINRALELNYPDNLKAKLYVRKVRNLLGLNPEMRLEIDEAVAEARSWMIKLNDTDKKLIVSNLNKLSQRESFPEPYKKPDCKYIISEITDANKTLPDASAAIELKYSEKYGRHFVATRDIIVGETLIKQQAYASIIENKLFYSHCWNCSNRAWAGIPCEHCVNVIFCNEQCRDEAWNKYHDIECAFITVLSVKHLHESEIMAIRLTIIALKEAGSVELLKEKLAMIDSIEDPITRAFTGEILDSNKYASIYTLARDPDLPNEAVINIFLKCAIILIKWASVSDIFGKKIDDIEELANNELASFMGGFLVKNLYIRLINGFEAIFYVGEYSVDRGTILSCLTSYLNHSCDSNTNLVHAGDIMAINCVHAIKKGQQIFISYGEYYQKSPRTNRRAVLHKRYHFECHCRACDENWGPSSKWTSFMDQPLSREVKKNLKSATNKFYEQFDGKSETAIEDLLLMNPSYIPSLSEFLNLLCEKTNYPCEEIRMHKVMLKYNFTFNSY